LSSTLSTQCFEPLCFAIDEHVSIVLENQLHVGIDLSSVSFFVFVQYDSNLEPRDFPFQFQKFIEKSF
jgi:hypothetical protein